MNARIYGMQRRKDRIDEKQHRLWDSWRVLALLWFPPIKCRGGGQLGAGGGNKIDSGALYRYADGGPEAAGISCAYL